MAGKSASAALLLAVVSLAVFATTASGEDCPGDALLLRACANALRGLVGVKLGEQQTRPCCELLGGLADADAAACLCTAAMGEVPGIGLNVPVDLTLLFNQCGRGRRAVPNGVLRCP